MKPSLASLMIAAAAGTAALVLTTATPADAQMRRQPNAAIGGAMTEAQARRACRNEITAGNPRRRVPAATLRGCIREKMVGGR